MTNSIDIIEAAAETDLERFLLMVFPPSWGGVVRTIIESGARFEPGPVKWAPRWSPVPLTIKRGPTAEIAAIKTVLYRTHDALHQLWGLSVPASFSQDEFYLYKRAQMCGEVAVLLINEMLLGSWISDHAGPTVQSYLTSEERCAVPMYRNELSGRSIVEIAARMDSLLHLQVKPLWVRESAMATSFVNYYLPMLEKDRAEIDWNWQLLKERTDWSLESAPATRYDPSLDGQELTVWMVKDFKHLLRSGHSIDRALATFNRERRDVLRLPDGWGMVP